MQYLKSYQKINKNKNSAFSLSFFFYEKNNDIKTKTCSMVKNIFGKFKPVFRERGSELPQ